MCLFMIIISTCNSRRVGRVIFLINRFVLKMLVYKFYWSLNKRDTKNAGEPYLINNITQKEIKNKADNYYTNY